MSETIVLVQFINARPFHVVTTSRYGGYDAWDFDWSERDRCLYRHNSGGGPALYLERGGAGLFWLAEGYPLPEEANPNRRLQALLVPYSLETLFADTEEDECEFCDACNSWIPHEDCCPHLWFCEPCAGWSTPYARAHEGCSEDHKIEDEGEEGEDEEDESEEDEGEEGEGEDA